MKRIGPWVLWTSLALGSAVEGAPPSEPTYWEHVRPVLRRHCTVCHSQRHLKEVEVSGGLALDSYEAVAKNAAKPLFTVGKAKESSFIQLLVTDDEGKRMPRGSSPLTTEQVELLTRWIDTGAKEGKKPDDDTPIVATPPAAKRRKLDVVVGTNAMPPKGVFTDTPPAKLEIVLKAGPLAPVTALAFNGDARLLAVGQYGRVTIWDTQTVQPVKMLTGVLGAVNDLKFSPDGSLLATAGGQPSAKGDLRLFQTSDWKPLATLQGHEDVVFSIDFSKDGSQLVSGSFDKSVRLWNVAERKQLQCFTGHSDFVYAVAFDPNGKYVASASKDRTVKLTDVATGKSLFTFSGMADEVLALAVSPDGKQVISGGYDGGTPLSIWDATKGTRLKQVFHQGGFTPPVHELVWSKDGKMVVEVGMDNFARVWNMDNQTNVARIPINTPSYAAALSHDNKLFAVGSFDGLTRIFSPANTRHLAILVSLPSENEPGDWLALTPEGYCQTSPGLAQVAAWRMSGRPLDFHLVVQTLGKPDFLGKALRAEPLPPPVFVK
jgi:glucose/arabinose dehydrogenase